MDTRALTYQELEAIGRELSAMGDRLQQIIALLRISYGPDSLPEMTAKMATAALQLLEAQLRERAPRELPSEERAAGVKT